MSDAKLDGQGSLSNPHRFHRDPPYRECMRCQAPAQSPASYMDCPGYPDEEVEGAEDPNAGVLDCHTCYHSLELHRNGVGCGAIADACTVDDCCQHTFPTGPNFRTCTKCGESRRELGRCGHYHEMNTTCAEGAKLIREAFEAGEWKDTKSQVHVVPSGSFDFDAGVAPVKRLQLVVTHLNESVTFYAVGPGKPWKIDAGLRLLIVGKGVGRMMVPLDNILYFTLEES